jgi:hypothetical protein
MKITPSYNETATGPHDWFTGAVYIDSIRNADDQSAVGCAHVRFTPGSRAAWHHHPRGQTLYVTDGIGYVARRGASRRRSAPGTSSTSSPARSTGTVPPPAGSWPTSPYRRPTTKARS